MKNFLKAIIVFYPFVAFATDYTDSTMPYSITLNGGSRSDTITASRGNGVATTVGYGRDPSFGISGAASSQYQLTFQSPNSGANDTTYYNGGITVGNNLQVAFNNLHTLAVERRSVSVGNGATFVLFSSGNSMSSAQFSDYGADSKVYFSRGASLHLGSNATANFTNNQFFIHNGTVSLVTGATLSVDSAKAIRFQNQLYNSGGTITLNGNVYNVGGSPNGISTSVSYFQSVNGTINVQGNFYNGGQVQGNAIDSSGSVAGGFNVPDPAFGGGGTLLLYGENMRMNVSGTFTSTLGGDLGAGGSILRPQNSSVGIYGATLSATTLNNNSGSTLTFGAYNGVMGSFNGTLNNNSTMIIDMAGASGGEHKIVNGTLNNNERNGASITLINGNTEFANATLSSDKTTVNMIINEDSISDFQHSLDSNQQAILNSLDNSYHTIYTLSGANSQSLKLSANMLDNAIRTQFFSAPQAAIDTIKNHLNADSVMSAQGTVATLSSDVSAIAGGMLGGASGGFGGIKAGLYYGNLKTLFSLQAAYMSGALNAKNHTSILQSNLNNKATNLALQASFASRFLSNNRLEFDINLIYANAGTKSTRHISMSNATQSFHSSFNLWQIALDTHVGYRFGADGGTFSLKPYVALLQSYNTLSPFIESTQSSGDIQALSTKGLNAYYISAALGLDSAYRINKNAYLRFGIDYEQFLLSTQALKLTFVGGDSISFDKPYQSRVGVNLRGRYELNTHILLGLDAQFKAAIHTDNLYYYGISAVFGYVF